MCNSLEFLFLHETKKTQVTVRIISWYIWYMQLLLINVTHALKLYKAQHTSDQLKKPGSYTYLSS